MNRYIVLFGVLCLLLASCAGTTASIPQVTPSPVAFTPEQVYQQWLDALRANDRQAALALLVPELHPNVDRSLVYFATMQRPTERGALTRVEPGTLTDAGVGKVALSTWVWPTVTECYQASLAQQAGQWKVNAWEKQPCPRS